MAGPDIAPSIAALIHVASILGEHGFGFTKNLTHAVEFARGDERIYLKTTGKLSLVLDPRILVSHRLGKIDGYESWNSNFSAFPKKMRDGKKPEKYGVAFDLRTPKEASVLLYAKGI
jgi:hypothetical protein